MRHIKPSQQGQEIRLGLEIQYKSDNEPISVMFDFTEDLFLFLYQL